MRDHVWSARFGLGFLIVAFVASACGPTPPTAQEGNLRDTIVIGMSQEPDTLFAPISSMMVQTNVNLTLSQGLTVRDQENKYQPRLAVQTPTLENGGAKLTKAADGKDLLTVTYKIRDGAKFSNGDPVTSEDVQYSWQLNQNKDVPIVSRVIGSKYQAVNTPDAKTVEVVFKPGELDPVYFAFCCTIVPKKVVSAIDPKTLKDSSFVRQPVYAGPYRVQEWQPGSAITVVANDDFWLGKPKTKTLIFKIIPDTNTLLAQLRAGQIDVATNDGITLDQIPELDKLPAEAGMTPHYTPAATWEHIDLNQRDPKDQSKPHPILSDKKLRQALAQGIDRDAITKQILYGKVGPIHSFLFGDSWAAPQLSDITVYKYDPEAAKKLLEEAGWKVGSDGIREKDGKKLELKMATTAANKMREQTTQVMARQLQTIGVKINIELLPASKYFATRGEGPLSAGTFDLGLYAWVAGDDPQSFIYYCDQIPKQANNFGGQNYPGYCNPEFDKVMIEANNKLTADEKKTREDRKALYLQAQKVWTADLPVIPLYQRLNIDVARSTFKNLRNAPTNTPVTVNAWEWELPK